MGCIIEQIRGFCLHFIGGSGIRVGVGIRGLLGHGRARQTASIITLVFVVFVHAFSLLLSRCLSRHGFICILQFKVMLSVTFVRDLASLPVMRICFMLVSCIIIH